MGWQSDYRWMAVLALVTACSQSTSTSEDCRVAAHACAMGFACVDTGQAQWQCQDPNALTAAGGSGSLPPAALAALATAVGVSATCGSSRSYLSIGESA